MLSDARTVAAGSHLEADVVIVGGGPAGISVATALLGSRLRVLLLEGGGREPTRRAQALYAGDVVGHPYYALDTCRFRLLGGSTNRWGGWCRPLEPTDFEARDWIPHSGWPIGLADLEPHHVRASELFRLEAWRTRPEQWAELPEPLPFGGGSFRNTLFEYCEQTNFADEHRAALEADPRTTVMLHADVTDLRLGTGPAAGRVTRVEVATLTGTRFTAGGGAVVLATGGIENARLLLAARRDRPAGLGNEHDLVGRFWMEHLHVPAGHLALDAAAAAAGFYAKAARHAGRTRGVLVPDPQAQRRHRLLGTSVALEEATFHYGTPFLGWPTALTLPPVRLYRRARHGRGRRTGDRVKGQVERLYNLQRAWQTRREAQAARRRSPLEAPHLRSLYFRSEQVPDRDSRVTLSDRTDEYGRPLARLDWRVGRRDTESIEAWLGLLDADARALGIGHVIAPEPGWEARIIGGPHHMGGTRMAARPEDGVVDADARVHSVENLYVTGSSVFATGGFANPTFTLVTLALRLAGHLRASL